MKAKSLKCVRDTRDFSALCFRLSSDGEKWLSMCQQRARIFDYLTTFADGDGTRVEVGIKRIQAKMKPISRSTIFRRLGDLEEIGVLINGLGLTGEHGTRRRTLSWTPLEIAHKAVTAGQPFAHPDSRKAEVSSETPAQDQKSQIDEAEVSLVKQKSQIEGAEVSKPRTFETQPTPTDTQTVNPTVTSSDTTDGWKDFRADFKERAGVRFKSTKSAAATLKQRIAGDYASGRKVVAMLVADNTKWSALNNHAAFILSKWDDLVGDIQTDAAAKQARLDAQAAERREMDELIRREREKMDAELAAEVAEDKALSKSRFDEFGCPR